MAKVLACVKLFLFALNAAWISIVQPVTFLFTKGKFSYIFPRLWHATACAIFGIKVEIVGQPVKDGQTIFMGNHISYLDIPVLGGVITGSFVAKEDVEGWALFGFLSKLQQTLFISRDRGSAKTVKDNLDRRLLDGSDLIIFPEGTSTDGRDVFPFKSSLFSLVVGSSVKNLQVQPVTIQVVETDGKPVDRETDQDLIDLYAWHLNMDAELDAHLWRFANTSGAKIRVIFHAPLKAADYDNRKVLAKACEDQVRAGLLTGRVS